MSGHTPYATGSLNGGVQKRYRFENEWGASVIRNAMGYGGRHGLWELAVINSQGDLDYSTPITSDVLGHLTDAQVEETLTAIATLPAAIASETVLMDAEDWHLAGARCGDTACKRCRDKTAPTPHKWAVSECGCHVAVTPLYQDSQEATFVHCPQHAAGPEALEAALNAAEDLKTVLVDDDELPGHVRKALRSAHDALEAVLAKVKS